MGTNLSKCAPVKRSRRKEKIYGKSRLSDSYEHMPFAAQCYDRVRGKTKLGAREHVLSDLDFRDSGGSGLTTVTSEIGSKRRSLGVDRSESGLGKSITSLSPAVRRTSTNISPSPSAGALSTGALSTDSVDSGTTPSLTRQNQTSLPHPADNEQLVIPDDQKIQPDSRVPENGRELNSQYDSDTGYSTRSFKRRESYGEELEEDNSRNSTGISRGKRGRNRRSFSQNKSNSRSSAGLSGSTVSPSASCELHTDAAILRSAIPSGTIYTQKKTIRSYLNHNQGIETSSSSTTVTTLVPSHSQADFAIHQATQGSSATHDSPDTLQLMRFGENCWDTSDGRTFEEVRPKCGAYNPGAHAECLWVVRRGVNIWVGDHRRKFQEIDLCNVPLPMPEMPCLPPNSTLDSKRSLSLTLSPASTLDASRIQHMQSTFNKPGKLEYSRQGFGHQAKIFPTLSPNESPDDDSFVGDSSRSDSGAESDSRFSTSTSRTLHPQTPPSRQAPATGNDLTLQPPRRKPAAQNMAVKDVVGVLKHNGTKSVMEKPKDYDDVCKEIWRIIKQDGKSKSLYFWPGRGGNYYDLTVQAEGLDSVQDEINQLKDKYPNYIITVSDLKPVFKAGGIPYYCQQLHGEQGVTFYLKRKGDAAQPSDVSDYIATIGGFVCDDQLNCFAFTVAHALVPEDVQRVIGNLAPKWPEYRTRTRAYCKNTLAGVVFDQHPYIATHDSRDQKNIKVSSTPLASVQLRTPSIENGQDCLMWYQKFSIDFMLLPLSPNKVFQDYHAKKPYDFVNQYRESIGKHLVTYPVTGYLDVRSQDDLELLRCNDVTVMIEGHHGTLEIAPEVFTEDGLFLPGIQIACHIDDPLFGGQSGSRILVLDEDKKECLVLGILNGSFKAPYNDDVNSTPLYLGTVFSAALKHMEVQLFDDHIHGKLQLVTEAGTPLTAKSVNGTLNSLRQSSMDTGVGESLSTSDCKP